MLRSKRSFSRTRRALLAMAAAVGGSLAVLSASSRAAVLYSNLSPEPSLIGDQSINGPNGAIFDDVLIDNFINNTSNLPQIEVGSVTVGILRQPGAGATTITGYWGTTTTPVNPTQFPILNNPQTSFGSVSIPAFAGATEAVEYFTITPASPFTVQLNLTDQPTFSEFAIGLSFSNTQANAWAVALPDTPDTNLDGAWDSNLVANTNAAYALEFNGNPIYTTFALEVNGTIVPEPGSVALVALAGVAIATRRKRR